MRVGVDRPSVIHSIHDRPAASTLEEWQTSNAGDGVRAGSDAVPECFNDAPRGPWYIRLDGGPAVVRDVLINKKGWTDWSVLYGGKVRRFRIPALCAREVLSTHTDFSHRRKMMAILGALAPHRAAMTLQVGPEALRQLRPRLELVMMLLRVWLVMEVSPLVVLLFPGTCIGDLLGLNHLITWRAGHYSV